MYYKIRKKDGCCVIGDTVIERNRIFEVKVPDDEKVYTMTVDIVENVSGYGHGYGDVYYNQNKVKVIIYKDDKPVGGIGKFVEIIEEIK